MTVGTEKAWMAGFVDGEGMLTIVKQRRKERPSPAFRADISISNTQRAILLPFQEEYGGKIRSYSSTRNDWTSGWSEAYVWVCPHSHVQRFLNDMLPYLRLKQKNATIILGFLTTKNAFARQKRQGRGGSAPLSDEEIALREEFRRAVRLFNRKRRA